MNITSCLCAVCQKLPDVVVESPCCHSLFCWNCILSLTLDEKSDEGMCTCPCCGERAQLEAFRENLAVQKIVDKTVVVCNHEGCNERFPASSRLHHEANCDFASTLCPHSDLCGIMTKNALLFHQSECPHRIVSCHLCSSPVIAGKLTEHLTEECTDTWVECVNRCGEEGIKRSSLEEHVKFTCPAVEIRCPYEPYGCEDEFPRGSVEDHLQYRAGAHLLLLATSVEPIREYTATLKDEVESLREEMEGLRSEVAALRAQSQATNIGQQTREIATSLLEHLAEAIHTARPYLSNITLDKVLPYLALAVILVLLIKTLNPIKQLLLFGFVTWFLYRSINGSRVRARGGGGRGERGEGRG